MSHTHIMTSSWLHIAEDYRTLLKVRIDSLGTLTPVTPCPNLMTPTFCMGLRGRGICSRGNLHLHIYATAVEPACPRQGGPVPRSPEPSPTPQASPALAKDPALPPVLAPRNSAPGNTLAPGDSAQGKMQRRNPEVGNPHQDLLIQTRWLREVKLSSGVVRGITALTSRRCCQGLC